MDRSRSPLGVVPAVASAAAALIACTAATLARGDGGADAKPKEDGPYEQVVQAYMEARWDDLEAALAGAAASTADLSPAQREGVAYVRRAMAECAPEWWRTCKKGEEATVRITLWGTSFDATFKPGKRSRFQTGLIHAHGTEGMTLTLDPVAFARTGRAPGALGTRGFASRDLTNMDVWQTIGKASVYKSLPGQKLLDLMKTDMFSLRRYATFRGNATALYYGSPPARRAALLFYLGAFDPKPGADKLVPVQRAAGALLLVEVLRRPEAWPSFAMPKDAREPNAEARAAKHFQGEVAPAWTVAEDRAMREAVWKFVRANEKDVLDHGRVRLPNGLMMMLDADEDAPHRDKRDAWVAERIGAIVGG